MDNTINYIKMCEKAEEIQEYGLGLRMDNSSIFVAGERTVWLPRQDQLQEMVQGEREICWLIDVFTVFAKDAVFDMDSPSGAITTNSTYAQQFTSMEQLWLAFVEKENYGKVWDGEDWVKAE